MLKTSKSAFGRIAAFAMTAVLLIGALSGVLPTLEVSAQDTAHTHCICGGNISLGEHTACSDVEFSPYSGGNVTYDASGVAYLYLESDVLTASESNNCVDRDGIFMVEAGKTLYLCLNGHSFQNSKRSSNVIDVYKGGKLVLCDCNGTGWIGGRQSGSNSGAVWVGGSFDMYGGSLKNNVGPKNGGGLYVEVEGTATMYGGAICDNYAFADGGGVCLRYKASFTMYGGRISGNRATDTGGGVYVHYYGDDLATFTMNGGVIEDNHSGSMGGGVFVTGTFVMNGGTVKGNTAARHGGGISAKWDRAKMTLNGGIIENNLAYGSGGGISGGSGAAVTMNGGVVRNNESRFDGGGIFLYGLDGWGDGKNTNYRLKFTMTGGTVENNKAGGFGGGIYFYEYTNFTFNATENDIIIADNEGSNLYLVDNKNYVINLTSLTAGSRIGVSVMRSPWVISTANDTDYSRMFSADSDDLHVGYDPSTKTLGVTPDFNKFKITYDLNGGEGTVTDSIGKSFTANCDVSITSAVPTRKCHTFLGWADSADATAATYETGDSVTLTADKKVYAVWSLSHVLTKVDKVEQTCTHDGKAEYWSCACGKYFKDAAATNEITENIEAWGILPAYHTALTKVDKVAPDCTHDGKEAYWSCNVCGKHYADEAGELAIDSLDEWGVLPARHSFTNWIAEVPATADSEGVSGHRDCAACEKHFDEDGNELDKLAIEKLKQAETDGDTDKTETDGTTEESGCKSTVTGFGALAIVLALASACLIKKKTADRVKR